MTVVFTILLLVCLWHLVYESMVAPTLRMRIRNELFRQRDTLRLLRIKGEIDDQVFSLLQEGLNNAIAFLHTLTPSVMYEIRSETRTNTSLRRQIRRRWQRIDSCNHPEIRAMGLRLGELLQMAFAVNAGGWFIFVVPMGFVLSAAETVRRLIAIPERDARRFRPVDGGVLA